MDRREALFNIHEPSPQSCAPFSDAPGKVNSSMCCVSATVPTECVISVPTIAAAMLLEGWINSGRGRSVQPTC